MKNKTNPLQLSNGANVSLGDIELSFIRAQGSGGQNVNKVSTAVHLRFDINSSSLSDYIKEKLVSFNDHHVTADGIIIIKAQSFRSQDKNRTDAIYRLVLLINKAIIVHKKRKVTRPTKASKQRRIEGKVKTGNQKVLRRKVDY